MNQLKFYDYSLPEELIAYYPSPQRDASRMLVLDKSSGNIHIESFNGILNYFSSGDCLVLNNTQVIKGRLYGKKEITSANVEVMLINQAHSSAKRWSCLIRPGKRVKPGTKVFLVNNKASSSHSTVYFTVLSSEEDGTYIVEFSAENVYELMDCFGHIPLPPYIKREDDFSDIERYQTVYSKIKGAVAAPTAGLHFTKEILNKITENGVSIAELTLHVGAGTFKPVQAEDLKNHKMHSEEYFLNEFNSGLINRTKLAGHKIAAVGTTSVRVLESLTSEDGIVRNGEGWTDIFIRPPYKFKTVDILLTNFHLPKSTLLMLVSAFAGLDNIMTAYQYAIKEKMRFFSYGDCMLII